MGSSASKRCWDGYLAVASSASKRFGDAILVVLDLLEGSWGGRGVLLGRSWAVSGWLWAGVGAVLGTLGRSWVARVDFGSEKGAKREAFWEAKRSQNRSKIEVQF